MYGVIDNGVFAYFYHEVWNNIFDTFENVVEGYTRCTSNKKP